MRYKPFFRSAGWLVIAAVSRRPAASLKSGSFKALLTLGVAFIVLASPVRAQFVYVANSGGNTVSGYSIGSNGALTAVPNSLFSAGYEPISVAVDQSKFVYVLTGNPHEVVMGFSIGSDGSLSALPGTPFATRLTTTTTTFPHTKLIRTGHSREYQTHLSLRGLRLLQLPSIPQANIST